MKVTVRGYTGTLIALEIQWTPDYMDNTSLYNVKLQVDKDITIDMVNIKSEEIELAKEEEDEEEED